MENRIKRLELDEEKAKKKMQEAIKYSMKVNDSKQRRLRDIDERNAYLENKKLEEEQSRVRCIQDREERKQRVKQTKQNIIINNILSKNELRNAIQ
jgi:hypothetical protein